MGLLTKALESHKGEIDAKDADDRTMLHWAAAGGFLEVVTMLLARGASVNVTDEEEWTPLLSAASAGRLGVVRALVEVGADVNATTSRGGTPLAYACSKNHLDVAAFLLEQGAKVDAKDANGDTPLHRAARHEAVVQLLLEKGGTLKRNKRGQTPLHRAAEEGSEAVCKLLLKHGGDATMRDDAGQTAQQLGGAALEHIWK